MARFKIKKIVFSSTAGIYGNPVRLPIKEQDPKTPTNPAISAHTPPTTTPIPTFSHKPSRSDPQSPQTPKVCKPGYTGAAPGSALFGLFCRLGRGVCDRIRRRTGDPGETVTVLEASTGKELSSHKLSMKPSPSGVAPGEILFVPDAKPPTAYVTNIFGGTIWAGTWDSKKKDCY